MTGGTLVFHSRPYSLCGPACVAQENFWQPFSSDSHLLRFLTSFASLFHFPSPIAPSMCDGGIKSPWWLHLTHFSLLAWNQEQTFSFHLNIEHNVSGQYDSISLALNLHCSSVLNAGIYSCWNRQNIFKYALTQKTNKTHSVANQEADEIMRNFKDLFYVKSWINYH